MANKKINQLVSKTAILSTDLFGIGDATTGQLFKKTIAELQAAIGGAVISVNGLVGTVVLDTDDIQELATPTNKYFTDARARGAISLTVTGNSGASTYSSGTGVLNVPTYTLAGLGGITATFLSGTSGISYNSTTGVITYSGTVYTDASIRALLSGSTGISYNSSTGAISYSGTVYTDSSVRALISITTTGTSGASTYNNTTGVINVPEYTLAGLGGISLTSLSGGTGITYNNTTGAISYSGTVYTDASVRALISATGNISYNSTTGVITTSLTQYTDALARASVSLTTTGTSGASTYNSTTGVFNIPNYGSALSGYLPLTGGTLTGELGGTSASFSSSVTATSGSTLFKEGYIIKATTTSGGGSQPAYTYYTAAGSKRWSHFLDVGSDKFNIANASNAEVFTITQAGNIGFGTTSPTPRDTGALIMELYGTSSGRSSLKFTNSTSGTGATDGMWLGYDDSLNFNILNNEAGYIALGTSNTERIRISSAGNVSITNQLTLTSYFNLIGGSSNANRYAYIYTSDTTFGIYAATGGGEVKDLELRSSGSATGGNITLKTNSNVLINTFTDNGYRLYVSGTIYATGNITANSDLTLKKNLTIINNPVDKLMQLNGYAYQWKEDDSHQYGVIAQEVEKILPYAVSTGNDGIKGVSYNQIIPVLIEAVKEQKTKIENLEILLASK